MKEFLMSPEVIAFLIAVFGLIAAYFLSRWTTLATVLIERVVYKFIPQKDTPVATHNSEVLVSRVVFYLALSFFLLLALKSLGYSLVNEVLDLVIVYVPKLLLGAAIILGGLVLGLIAKSATENLTEGAAATVLPKLAQYLVVISAVITGLGHMEINVSFVANLLFILFAVLLGSISIAFALGAQNVVANMLARREIAHLRQGDELRLGSTEGVVKALTQQGLTLETGEGEVFVPASLLTSQPFLKKSVRAE
ncbi:MAG: hypothetical protein ACJA0W_002908 [Candidatus Azotimanducaceae bacterium]